MYRCDLNIKNMNMDSYSEAKNWCDFEKSNFDWLYIQIWFAFQKNEGRFMLGRLKLVEDKMVKSLNVH